MSKGIVVVAVLAVACGVVVASSVPATRAGQSAGSGAPSIEQVAWLAGDWQTPGGERRQTDEHWTPPRGGAMLGLSRTVAAGRMAEFEYLRIIQRSDGLYYVAHPNARTPGTEFKATTVSPSRAVFENRQHDFPKRITYERSGDGALTATVDGGEGTRAVTFRYVRMER